MLANTKSKLNDDCWDIVLSLLSNDFRTLSRVLQVSRYFLAIGAPILYGQLGDPSNKERFESWSIHKRNRLAALLLASSGCLDSPPSLATTQTAAITTTTKSTTTSTSTGISTDDDDDNYSDDDRSDQHNNNDIEEFKTFYHYNLPVLRLPIYKTPLSINYFGLLTLLPKYLVPQDIWNFMMENVADTTIMKTFSDGKNVFKKTAESYSRILTEVHFHGMEGIQKWLPFVERFQKLEKLEIGFWETCSKKEEELLYEFVGRHKVAFPGQLKEIGTMLSRDTELMMRLNIFLDGPEKMTMRLYNGIHCLFEEDNNNSHGDISNNNDHNNSLAKSCKSIKTFVFDEMDNIEYIHDFQSRNVAFLARFLQESRQLETVSIFGANSRRLGSVFEWAPQELFKAETMGMTSTSFAIDQKNSPTSTPTATTTMSTLSMLVPLESFEGGHVEESTLWNIMDGFRYTLEQIDFTQGFGSVGISFGWSWMMPRLKILKLRQCCVQLRKLELYCPALEELYLDTIRYPQLPLELFDDLSIQDFDSAHTKRYTYDLYQELGIAAKPWKAMSTLRVLHLIDIAKAVRIDFASFRCLEQLKELSIDFHEELEADTTGMLERIEPVRLLNWNLSRLERLMIIEPSNLDWQRLLLQSAPNLMSVSILSAFPEERSGGFWYETRMQSFEKVVECESRMNQFRPDYEQEQKQREKELEREKWLIKNEIGDGEGVLNAYTTKIRSLELGGEWTRGNVDGLKGFLQRGNWKKDYTAISNSNDNGDNNNKNRSSITGSDESDISTRICFPSLQHFRFSEIVLENTETGFNELIRTLMQRRGLVRVDVPRELVPMEFREASLQWIDAKSVPPMWDIEEDCYDKLGVNQRWDDRCMLVVHDEPRDLMCYRLKEETS